MGSKQRHAPSLVLERISRSRSEKPLTVVGIDEVGTGAYAGPIVVGAVAFEDDETKIPTHVRDSKTYSSREEREKLFDPIINAAIMVGIGITTPDEIDDWGSKKAREVAIIRAFKDAKKRYSGPRVVAVVDGRNLKQMRKKLGGSCAVFADRADQKSYSVAAASVIAKVTRDAMMAKLAVVYPNYGFATNVGYGTKEHWAALLEYGVCKIHRRTVKPIRRLLEGYYEEKESIEDFPKETKARKTKKTRKTS